MKTDSCSGFQGFAACREATLGEGLAFAGEICATLHLQPSREIIWAQVNQVVDWLKVVTLGEKRDGKAHALVFWGVCVLQETTDPGFWGTTSWWNRKWERLGKRIWDRFQFLGFTLQAAFCRTFSLQIGVKSADGCTRLGLRWGKCVLCACSGRVHANETPLPFHAIQTASKEIGWSLAIVYTGGKKIPITFPLQYFFQEVMHFFLSQFMRMWDRDSVIFIPENAMCYSTIFS